MISDFAAVRAAARTRGGGLALAVVAATDETIIQAAVAARAEGLAESVLIGPEGAVRALLEAEGADPGEFRIEDVTGDEACAERGAALAAEGAVGAIVKGHASSAAVIRAVLSRRHGLRTGRALSDVRLCEHPMLPGRLLGLTDGGVIPLPTLAQRRDIVENAVQVYHRLGYERPRVALLAASEKVTDAVPHTAEARTIVEMARRGELGACDVDGPLSFDLAVSAEAAARKGYASEVAGRAEILVGPNIETINVLAKSIVYFLKGVPGQVVMGARVPVLIPSRADAPEVKLNSIALAALVR